MPLQGYSPGKSNRKPYFRPQKMCLDLEQEKIGLYSSEPFKMAPW